VIGVHKIDPRMSQQARGIDAYVVTVAEAKEAGADFVIAYLAEVPGKCLTRARAHAYSEAGLSIVSVYEGSGTRARDGEAAGAQDAEIARRLAGEAGQPDDAPIYFAVDFDTSPAPSIILPYFDGLEAHSPPRLNGAYGGFDTMAVLFDHEAVGWGYQTEAWSEGRWHADARLRQVGYGRVFDTDVAVAGSFGQWRL
jgi:hypothetical protein